MVREGEMNPKDTGMCEHGNFPETCEACPGKKDGLVKRTLKRIKDGLSSPDEGPPRRREEIESIELESATP